MKKILVSDLIGTLFPYDYEEFNELYGDISKAELLKHDDEDYKKYLIDKMILILKNNLKPFLEDGNYLYIVTSVHDHESLDFIVKNFFLRIYDIFNEYSNNIFFFASCNSRELNCLYNIEEFEKLNNGIASFNNGMTIVCIKDKEQVYEHIKNIYDYHLYAVGDTESTDLKMLLKCIELGGKSCFIYESLYSNIRFNLGITLNRYISNNFDDSEIDSKEKYQKLVQNILKLMSERRLEITDLQNNNIFYEIRENYNFYNKYDPNGDRNNLISDISEISKLLIYKTFQEFLQNEIQKVDYTKILKE